MAKRTGKSKLMRQRMRFLEATVTALKAERDKLKEEIRNGKVKI